MLADKLNADTSDGHFFRTLYLNLVYSSVSSASAKARNIRKDLNG